MTQPKPEPIDNTIVHPEPDMAPTEADGDQPPPTWNPEKARPE